MKDKLIAFEDRIAESFNNGEIPYPVHLESGNEDQLIEIFKNINKEDYIFGSWRLHIKALLKGIPEDELEAAIRRGESMALYFPKYKVYGSAIVGGTIPIALGAALDIRRKGGHEHVWCFLGDMTARCGIYLESRRYADNFNLPISWIIEDNGVSVCTNTELVCGDKTEATYTYKSKYPHAGAGQRVQFWIYPWIM